MPEYEPIAGSRVAFFGGSFDPPHEGHLAVARAAREALSLDTILFAPVGAQPLKPAGTTALFADRVAMTELAIGGETGFAVSLADAPCATGEPNYTLDTLLNLRNHIDTDASLFCLMGADSLRGLRRWYRAAEIPFAAALIVASRPGEPLDNLAALMPPGLSLHTQAATTALETYTLTNASGATAPFYILPGLHVDISASQIRTQLRAAYAGTAFLLPPAVASYIAANHLYASAD